MTILPRFVPKEGDQTISDTIISAKVAVLEEVQRWYQSNFGGRILMTESDYKRDHSNASAFITYLDDKIAELKRMRRRNLNQGGTIR